jgi:hypothetical protein
MEESKKKMTSSTFGHRDFRIALCICFLRMYDRFEVVRDFRSSNEGENQFPVHRRIEEKITSPTDSPTAIFYQLSVGELSAIRTVSKLFVIFVP